MNKDEELDSWIDTHDSIKSFIINKSTQILNNFKDKNHSGRFNLLIDPESTPDSDLSSTTVCTYTLTRLVKIWDDNKKSTHEFGNIKAYYNFVIKTLFLSKSLDEFSILNVLSLLKDIQTEINIDKDNISKDEHKQISEIVKRLCDHYNPDKDIDKDRIPFSKKRHHPIIYYKLVNILDWAKEINYTDQDNDTIRKFKNKIEMTCDMIYESAKNELYQQISFYSSNDRTLFDVKRLIYSLLIVKNNEKFSHNLIKDKALEIIFDEQIKNTGFLPIGHVVNTDFFITKEKDSGNFKIHPAHRNKTPVLSSVECFNDLLNHKNLRADMEDKYCENFKLVHEWVCESLRRDSSGNLKGWFPEYESKVTFESWIAGHSILFLINYCELLSDKIQKRACKDLQNIESEKIDTLWQDISDSYNIKKYVEYIIKETDNYRSMMLFGPPGTGKSKFSKALAKELKWNYVEITPGIFLSEGQDKIISNANEIFKRLMRLKKTVVFFDEVDQLVENREKNDKNTWIVTSLLPKFSDLRKQKDIIFVLATNHIEKVDKAIIRRGRIDLILPMGGISWKSRLNMLIKEINKKEGEFKLELKTKICNLESTEIDGLKRSQIDDCSGDRCLSCFLEQTKFVTYDDIKQVIDISSINNFNELEKKDIYKIFFHNNAGIDSYRNDQYMDFHKKLIKDHNLIRLPFEHRNEGEISLLIEEL